VRAVQRHGQDQGAACGSVREGFIHGRLVVTSRVAYFCTSTFATRLRLRLYLPTTARSSGKLYMNAQIQIPMLVDDDFKAKERGLIEIKLFWCRNHEHKGRSSTPLISLDVDAGLPLVLAYEAQRRISQLCLFCISFVSFAPADALLAPTLLHWIRVSASANSSSLSHRRFLL
jgi:hypothetical protein